MQGRRIKIVMDNHSSHRSGNIEEYLEEKGVEIIFLPSYSSTLNPVERVWSLFKHEWAKELSKVKFECNDTNAVERMKLICDDLKIRLTSNILNAANHYIEQVEQGNLV